MIDSIDDREAAEEIKEDLMRDDVMPDLFCEEGNPKDIIGRSKLPLHLWPMTATAMGSIAMLNGALKYGRANWRAINVNASVYVDACQRHLTAWFEGNECDEEGVPHLGSALACIAILIDAKAAGTLNDDRQVEGGYQELIQALSPHVARLRQMHADKSPKHWTIQDSSPAVRGGVTSSPTP